MLMNVRTLGWTLLTASAVASAAMAGDVVVNGTRVSRTFDCKGEDAVLNGSHNEVTFQNCDTVTVNGSQNSVNAKDADTVTVIGSSNTVKWSGRKPTVVNTGRDNHVQSADGGETSER